MKRLILGGILAAATLTGTLAFTSAGATALGGLITTEGPEVCYEQVPYQEYKYTRTTPTTEKEYKKTIETPKYRTENQYGKSTQTRARTWTEGTEATPDQWWVWAPTASDGPQEYVPEFETDERGKWVGPNDKGGPNPGTYGTFNAGNGNSSWFHREQGEPGTDGYWSEWSVYGPLTDWPWAGPLDWGVIPNPISGDHDGAETNDPSKPDNYNDRRFEYLVVDTRQVPDGVTISYEYQWSLTDPGAPWVWTGNTRPGTPIVEGPTGWLLNPPDGEGWVQVGERTSYENGDQIPCGEQPDPLVEETEERTCAPPGSTSATVTTTTTTTEYVLNDDFEWVPGKPSVTVTTEQVPLSEEEADDPDCAPPVKVTFTEWVDGEFECGDTRVEQTRTQTTTPFIWVPAEDDESAPVFGEWVLDTDKAVTVPKTETRELKPDEIEVCPIVLPPTSVNPESKPPVVPPATAPPATQAPAVEAPAGQLPSTGSSSWVAALIALVALAGGTGLVRLSRRPTD